MTMYYEQFYKRFGIRKAEQLISPPLAKLQLLELPKQSILHYVATSPLEAGPDSNDYLFREITRPIAMSHVTEIGDTKGHPRKLSILVTELIRHFHTKNRRFRLMRNLESAEKDINTLIVYNYGIISQMYRYMRSISTEYYKWWNTQAALWKNVAEVSKQSDRQQFILCKLPTVLPSMSDMSIGTAGVTQRMVKIFNSPERLELLEIWKWLGPDRESSVLAVLPEEAYERTNLIFQESGRWFVINLGRLNKWRVASKEELALDPKANSKGLDAGQMQRRFLRLSMALFQVRTMTNKAIVVETTADTDVVPSKNPDGVIIRDNLDDDDDRVDSGDPDDGEDDNKRLKVIVQDPLIPMQDPITGVIGTKTRTIDIPEEAHFDGMGLNDPDDDATDIHHDEDIDKQIIADLAELENISRNHIGPHDDEDHSETEMKVHEAATLEDGVMSVCDRLADTGLLSAAEYRRFNALSSSYKNIMAPDGQVTLDKFIQIPPEALKIDQSPAIKDIPTIVDKTMLQSSLHTFDSAYTKNIMSKDIAHMVLSIQNAGIAVTGYEVERIDDVLGSTDYYSVKLVPVVGVSSTFRFKLPVINDDGTYMSSNTKYRLRKQRGDIPIRKTAPDRVALSSYYGKVFVSRSTKRVNDYGQWLRNCIMTKGLSETDQHVINLHPSNVFDESFLAPKIYSTLAMGFRGFTMTPWMHAKELESITFSLSFDHTKREILFGESVMKLYERDGSLIVGMSSDGQYLVVDKNDTFYAGTGGKLTPYGTIETLLGLESEKAPIDFAELKVLGRTIPIGIVLAYELGLDGLMKMLKVEPRRVPAGTRANLSKWEYSLVFSDETLVFNRDDKAASMVLAGFNEFHRAIRGFSVYEFDKRGVYLNILETGGSSARYLREVDLMYQMFVDPITKELLIEMKEPIDFRGLLIRSCEMLLNDQHPDEFDSEFLRIKGYERLPGAVYSEIIKALRAHNGRSGRARYQIDLNPYAVWKTISQDPAVMMVSDINPIENLKQMEAVTYSGVGGRNSRSMTKRTRVYHKNDMGTISESTVDSGDVGINMFTSADPQFTTLRGLSRRYENGKTGATALLSTSALLSVAADVDDPKRTNFIAIQQSHGIACNGYSAAPVRTGYEQVLAHRTGDLFAYTAKKAGTVISVSPTGMVVEYEDGEKKGIELGRRFGAAAGLTIPHNVVPDVQVGQAFEKDNLLCHNDGFFEKDMLNPNGVVWKAGVMVKTVLLESTTTLEDSSAISPRVAKLLTTKATKVKDILVRFDQSVRKLVKVGDSVESENILCIIEDAVTANVGLFDEESLDTLRMLSSQTPQAKAKGTIERIEVFYHGDKADMSESLRSLVNVTDAEMTKRNKSAGKKGYTGSVNEGFRIAGDPLTLDTLAIRIYITSDVPAGVGDKGVFANQMKTVFGEVLSGEVKTESGVVIDAIFGAKSIGDRIVNSPYIIGTTATLLSVIAAKAVKAYRA